MSVDPVEVCDVYGYADPKGPRREPEESAPLYRRVRAARAVT